MTTRMINVLCCLLLLAGTSLAGTLRGSVRNGTTNTVVGGHTVVLMKLMGGMEEVDSTKTDAQGFFKFDRAEIGQQPFLVRVNYKGVFFHASVPPAKTTAEVEVFEPTGTAADLHVISRAVILQPNGGNLVVGEEYDISNTSKPPVAFSKEFEFAIPEGAEITQVAAWGPSGMPTVQGTINKGKNRYAISFPLRPGKNGIRLSYSLAYATQQARIGVVSSYATESLMVVAPPQMQISGEGLQPAGQREGWSVYARSAVPAGVPLNISVAGTAPPPPAEASGPVDAASSPAAGGSPEVRAMPARLDDLKLILTGGFVALFALGAFFLWRKQSPAMVAPAPAGVTPAPVAAPIAAPAHVVAAAIPAQVEQQAKLSLDQLKDSFFRLELRRQAGTISEEEYARERERTEKTLRGLVRD